MATLLEYLFTSSSANPTTSASGVTGGAVTKGSLASMDIGNYDSWASQPVLCCCPANGATSASTSVTENSYFSIAVTPDTGNTLNLSLLHLHAGRGGSSTPRGLKVRSSIDSYAADLYSAEIGTATPTWTDISIDLSGAAFQGIGAITFRFYIWTPSTSNSVDEDEIRLEGTVVSASSLKTVNGLAKASVKTINGLAIASVKTWNGLA